MAGDQEQSNAGDQEDRTFEVIKLRIAFLQHITTLSGAAILIILALVKRAETASEAFLLATTVALFSIAALISVFGVMFLILDKEPADYDRASIGSFPTGLAGAVFAAGILAVAYAASGGSVRWFLLVSTVVIPIGYSIVRIWSRRR